MKEFPNKNEKDELCATLQKLQTTFSIECTAGSGRSS